MKTKNQSENGILKLASILFFMFIVTYIACGQEPSKAKSSASTTSEWWSPILKKHDITPSGYNNFEKVFEMGSINSRSNQTVTLENAFFLLKPEGDEYIIIKSLKAYHDLDSNIIRAENGSMDLYSLKSKDTNPRQSISFDNLKYDVENKRSMATNVKGTVTIK